MSRVKAAVCYEFGKPMVVEDIELDSPQRGEVKVRLAATAICHSDIHLIKGEFGPGATVPCVAGHESAGFVEELGEGVTRFKVGDYVAVSLIRPCGVCDHCLKGSQGTCEGNLSPGIGTRMHTIKGTPIQTDVTRVASFAEYTVVDQSQVIAIPGDIPATSAALLSCGVITGAGAVLNTANVEYGSSVVVIGVGGVGLNVIQGAVLASAHPIIAVDLVDSKLEAAKKFGATHAINAAKEKSPRKRVLEINGGRGVDYAFVTAPSAAAEVQAFNMLDMVGTEVLIGFPAFGETVSLPAGLIVQGRKVIGSVMGDSRLAWDIPRLVKMYKISRLKLDELVSGTYPLERINEAVASTERGDALRNVIVFDVKK